jgi:diadenosine tetraphosphate (Ap4A) HIT family hydrolase
MSLGHWEKFRPSDLACREFRNWLVVVRQKQVTLGSCVFLVKRPVSSVAQLNTDELSEFADVASWFETATRNLFAAEQFNYVAAMMKNTYVHFHVFPRYSTLIVRYGIEWHDYSWPNVVEFLDVDTPDRVLGKIKADLQSTG